MELDAVEFPRPGPRSTAARVLAVLPVRRKPGGTRSSRSPWLIQTCASVLDLGQEPDAVEDAEGGEAVFALLGRDDLAAEEVGHELDAVADAQDRDAEVEDALGRVGRALVVDALRARRKGRGRTGPALRIAASGVAKGRISE